MKPKVKECQLIINFPNEGRSSFWFSSFCKKTLNKKNQSLHRVTWDMIGDQLPWDLHSTGCPGQLCGV